MYGLIKMGFKTSLLMSISLGVLLVLGQILGLVVMNGQMMSSVYDLFAPFALVLSAVAAILGFLLNYLNKENTK